MIFLIDCNRMVPWAKHVLLGSHCMGSPKSGILETHEIAMERTLSADRAIRCDDTSMTELPWLFANSCSSLLTRAVFYRFDECGMTSCLQFRLSTLIKADAYHHSGSSYHLDNPQFACINVKQVSRLNLNASPQCACAICLWFLWGNTAELCCHILIIFVFVFFEIRFNSKRSKMTKKNEWTNFEKGT